MRIDRLLVFLRFARTRSRAAAMVEDGHIRCNGRHVARASQAIACGDVLTLPLGEDVRIVRIECLPDRRGPPGFARSHYHELDRNGQTALAAENNSTTKGE